jgi:hypothetical protein
MPIEKLELCDFSPIARHLENLKENKKIIAKDLTLDDTSVTLTLSSRINFWISSSSYSN